MKIVKAKPHHLEVIKMLTEACARHMRLEGIFQWNEHYPSRERLAADLEAGHLFALRDEGVLYGTVVISPEKDAEYEDIEWLTPDANNFYIHRLAVDPSRQKMGYARMLMDFAENYARERGAASIRLDTFSQNERNNRFYQARGYKKLGDVYFPKQSKSPFHCYELVF